MANIITALSIFYSLMTVSLGAPFIFGLLARELLPRERSAQPALASWLPLLYNLAKG